MTSRLVRCGELDVAYREWHADASGNPIVAIHGNWGTAAVWTRVAEALPRRRVLAMDLRGRGETRGRDRGYAIDELAGDVREFLDTLGCPCVDLVGHSLGAAIVAEFGLRWPEPVESLTLIAPMWVDGMPAELDDPERQRRMFEDPVVFAKVFGAMAPSAARDDWWTELLETCRHQSLAASLANLEALRRWQPGDRLRALQMNRQIIVGANDKLVVGAIPRAAEVLGVEPIVLAEIGHSPQIEWPGRVAQLIG